MGGILLCAVKEEKNLLIVRVACVVSFLGCSSMLLKDVCVELENK